MRRLANHGAEHHHLEVGFNSHLPSAALSVKLVTGRPVARRQVAAPLRRFAGPTDLIPPFGHAAPPVSPVLYVVAPVQTATPCSAVFCRRIPTAVYYPTPLSSQPALPGARTEGADSGARVAGRILTELTEAMQTRVVAELFRLLPSTWPNPLMNIAVVGTGYVGLVTGVPETGNHLICGHR